MVEASPRSNRKFINNCSYEHFSHVDGRRGGESADSEGLRITRRRQGRGEKGARTGERVRNGSKAGSVEGGDGRREGREGSPLHNLCHLRCCAFSCASRKKLERSCGIEPHGAATSGDQGVFFGDILVVVPG